MRRQRRNRSETARRVEDLEGRIAPSVVGMPGAWRAMSRMAARSLVAVQHIARPSPAQDAPSSARNLGPGPMSRQGIGLARFPGHFAPRVNPMLQPTWNVRIGPRAFFNVGLRTMRTNPPNSPNPPAEPTTPVDPPPTTIPTAPASADATPPIAPLPPNASGALNALYQDYSKFVVDHPAGSYSPPPNLGFPVVNNQVGVNISGNGQGDFAAFVDSLRDLGMNVTSTNAVTWTVSGMLPIGELATVANNSQTLSVAPRYAPIGFGGPMRF